MELSHDEAQRRIYRGCARLDLAMRVRHIPPETAQNWEAQVLRESVRGPFLATRMRRRVTSDPRMPTLHCTV